MFGITKDALLQTKECALELQSIMKRRRGGEMGLTREVEKYLISREVIRKAIHKAWKSSAPPKAVRL